jgi:hypothetical protein
MPVRLGLNVGGLLTAEITTASTLKTMRTRKGHSNDVSGQLLIVLQFAHDLGLVVQDRVQQ